VVIRSNARMRSAARWAARWASLGYTLGLRSTRKSLGHTNPCTQARWYAIYFISATSTIESDGTWLISAGMYHMLLTERDGRWLVTL
jgi:hypothetical protein